MIKVIIHKEKNQIKEIKVSGHADSAEYGKDLVCAGVSTTCIGIANALCQNGFLSRGTIDLKNGFIDVKVNQLSERDQVVLETFETILMTIEESYSKYIKITKMEV